MWAAKPLTQSTASLSEPPTRYSRKLEKRYEVLEVLKRLRRRLMTYAILNYSITSTIDIMVSEVG